MYIGAGWSRPGPTSKRTVVFGELARAAELSTPRCASHGVVRVRVAKAAVGRVYSWRWRHFFWMRRAGGVVFGTRLIPRGHVVQCS